MAQLLRYLVFFVILLPFTVSGEGSKQLTPNMSSAALTSTDNDKAGYLAHDANFPSADGVAVTSLSFLKPAGFSRNGATFSPDHRLYIRVKAGENLLYGVRRAIHDQTTASQSDLIITIRGFNGTAAGAIIQRTTLLRNRNSTRDMLLNTDQAGVIDNAAQAYAGPAYSVGGVNHNAGGYAPLIVTNTSGVDQDYWVEFEQVGEANFGNDDGRRFSVYDLWDFTVIDVVNGRGVERPGRMRSKLWSFSAGGTNNVFSRNFDMYPLIPSETQENRYYVKVLELAGIAPQNFFRVVTNKYGTRSGSSVTERRKSQRVNSDYPEYFNFVNNPDPDVWPTAEAPTFSVDIDAYCSNPALGTGAVTFTGNSNETSTFIVLIDLNNNGLYDTNSRDVLLEQTGVGTKVITWNGLDGKGVPVPKGTTIKYLFTNGSGPVNFPVWDAETNLDGFRVGEVRPLPAGVSQYNYASKLYWDNSNLDPARFPSPLTQLFGQAATDAYSDGSGGVNRWGANNANAGDLYTVNTWTYGYTNELEKTLVYTYDCNADVAVTNTVGTAPYTVGKPFTYTVTVKNNGPMAASNVQVTDKLDLTKLSVVSASDANYVATTGVWPVGSLAVGASKTLTITAKPLVLGSISATAAQTHTEADNNTTNNSATATINVVAAADIEIKSSSDKSAYNNGDLVTYTITAKNLGPNTATGVAVIDKLPAGLVLQGNPAGYDAATGNWAVGNLGVNETRTLTLIAQINSLTAKTNTASLVNNRASYQIDENVNNNSSSNTITVSPVAEVGVTSTVNNPNPGQNELVTFTIKATNAGPNNASNVSVANPIPAGMAITSFNASSGTFDKATGTWAVGNIITGGSQTLTVSARATAVGSYSLISTQTHTESDNQTNNNTATSTFTVKATADVAVTNSVSSSAGPTYVNGETVTYTVTVTNNGPSSATNVVVTDHFPTSMIFTNGVVSMGSGTINTQSGDLVWTVGTLAPGATGTLTVSGTIKESAVMTTTATQTHTEYDNVEGNNSASNSIQAGSGTITADIEVSTSTPASVYYTNDEVPFRVLVKNAGPDAATDINLNASLPAGFTFVSANPNIGTYSDGTWIIPTLASGASTELFLTGRPNVDLAATGDKNYVFTAATGTLTQFDNDATNNSASTPVTVRKKTDVAASISITSDDPSGNFYNLTTVATFRISVTNNGPDIVTGLAGQDTRTGTINFIVPSINAPAGTNYDAATGIWTIGTLAVGETKTLEFKGTPNRTGRINLGGGITGQDQLDTNPENNSTFALMTVLPVAELEITNTASAPTFINGNEAAFTVTVKNNGPDAATGVVIEDKLPAGLAFVSATATSGSYDPATGRWTLGNDILPYSAEMDNIQTLVLKVKPQAAITYSTTASVLASAQYDNKADNNSQTASIQGSASADVAVTGSIVAGPYYVNGQYLVTMKATNYGPDPATDIIIAAGVVPGLNFVPGSGTPDAGSSINPANGLWMIPVLGVNETKTMTLQVQPTALGILNSIAYKYMSAEFDANGGNTKDGNNTAVIYITAVDREAVVQGAPNSKHYYLYKTGETLAKLTDPDGNIVKAKLVSGTLPTGVIVQNDGSIGVSSKFLLKPGSYSLNIETTDEYGGVSTNVLTYSVSEDWDNDGVPDDTDVDDNNDGIRTEISENGANPLEDSDGDGIRNYLDGDYNHPVYGAFTDKNFDDINDWFDLDRDGLIRGFDLDIDGDGITNMIEANGGTAPESYNPLTATFTGGVSANGMPLAAQTGNNNGVLNLPNPDSDQDGLRDYEDVDADNDGILDNDEAQTTQGYISGLGADSDFDGLNDGYDTSTGGTTVIPVDSDGDGIPDYLDRNSDDDIAPDYAEAFDDDMDGVSINDLIARADAFESINLKGWYMNTNIDASGVPEWLKNENGHPGFLTKSSSYYHDTDFDGLVDLFDKDNSGFSASLQTASDNEYPFRSGAIITPLPVTLLKFTGNSQQDGVALSWATATEKDNDHFEIERSIDGNSFVKIASVNGNGNSSRLINYNYLDTKAPAGIIYYRLKQVDINGKFVYSSAISVTSEKMVSVRAQLYPNPVSDIAHLDMSMLPVGRYTVRIINMQGRILHEKVMTSQPDQEINVQSLASGKYIIQIQGTGTVQTINMIKL